MSPRNAAESCDVFATTDNTKTPAPTMAKTTAEMTSKSRLSFCHGCLKQITSPEIRPGAPQEDLISPISLLQSSRPIRILYHIPASKLWRPSRGAWAGPGAYEFRLWFHRQSECCCSEPPCNLSLTPGDKLAGHPSTTSSSTFQA